MTPSTFRQPRTGALVFCFLLVIGTGLLSIDATQASQLQKSQAVLETKAHANRGAPDPKHKAKILSEYGRLPLQFEANKGQTDPQVQFVAHAKQFDLFLLPDEVVFAIPEVAPNFIGPPTPESLRTSAHERQVVRWGKGSYVSMRLAGVRQGHVVGKERLPGTVNYFIGNDPRKWRTGVPLFATVEYPELIPGVDLDFRGVRQQSEFDLILHSGTDASVISLIFDGARALKLDKSGDIVVSSRSGELRLLKPVAYQEAGGKRVPVEAEFVRKKRNEVAFRVGPYDRSRELVIDPSVMYSSYLGGSSQDEALGVALDSQNNAYITGATSSPDFPLRAPQQGFTGTIDGFVTKLDASGGSLVFSTYIGGSSTAYATAVTVLDQPDAPQPAVYITGYTDSFDLPFPPGYTQDGYAGGLDAFIWMLDLSGTSVLGGSYIGGAKDEVGTGISIDLQGYAWVVGWTKSSVSDKFPLVNPLQNRLKGTVNAFITQVAPSTLFAFSSYLGGSKQDFASAVAIDKPLAYPPQYTVYVTGGTNSPDFPTTPFAVQPQCGTDGQCNGGKDDAFVTAISYSSGRYSYAYSTFLGGAEQDDGYGIAADVGGNAYLTGQTSSIQFPTTSGAYQNSLHGAQNSFATKLNPTGTALAYSTFLGGSAKDAGLGIAVDGNSNIYVTGRTLSSDFPTLNATQPNIGGHLDAFVSAFVPLNNSPTLAFSTFLGGSGDEDLAGGGIAVDNEQNVYVVGDTNSSDFTITLGAYQKKFAGSGTCTIGGVQAPCEDAFITKISTAENPTLNVIMTGTGSATITSSPPGISCSQIPGSCQAKFNFGTQVTLTEQPTNTTFNGWTGAGCSGTGDCVLTLTSDQTVSADFTLNVNNVTLTVVVGGTGTGQVLSMPPGIRCSQGTCTGNFPQGTAITLTATPGSDSIFAGWTGPVNCLGSDPCTFTLNSATTVGATFNTSQPTLTVIASGDPGSGTVVSNPSGISCTAPLTCSSTFTIGTTITLRAQAAAGYTFAGWNGQPGCVGTSDCTITLNSDQSVTAVFSTEPSLNVQVVGTGLGTVTSNPAGIKCPPQATCTAPFELGTQVTLTATPDSSSTFDGWGGTASACSTNRTCTIAINQFLVGAVATFTQIYVPPPPPFSLTASPSGGSTIPVGGSTAYGLSLVSFNGFTDAMSLACSVQPASSASPVCTLTPSSVTLGTDQAASSTLTISAGGLIARNTMPGNRRLASYELNATMLMFSFIGGVWIVPSGHLHKGRGNRSTIALLFVLAALAIQVGCGGGGKSGGSATSGSNAQPGNYVVTVTVTGSMTQVSQSISIPVTVQ